MTRCPSCSRTDLTQASYWHIGACGWLDVFSCPSCGLSWEVSHDECVVACACLAGCPRD